MEYRINLSLLLLQTRRHVNYEDYKGFAKTMTGRKFHINRENSKYKTHDIRLKF